MIHKVNFDLLTLQLLIFNFFDFLKLLIQNFNFFYFSISNLKYKRKRLLIFMKKKNILIYINSDHQNKLYLMRRVLMICFYTFKLS
jgi:hypothetical protein